MKTVRVTVAVALLLAFVWIQESSAQPHSRMAERELKAEASVGNKTSPFSWTMFGMKCRFCCGCCTPGVCGICCRF